jgi:hypothetical protein
VALASVSPGIWATSGLPPDRALVSGVVAVLAWVAILGWSIGGDLHRPPRWLLTGAAACLLLAPVVALVQISSSIPTLAAWAEHQDELAAALSSGSGTVEWSPMAGPLFDNPGSDPGFWANRCVAGFYGIPAVTVRAP